MRLRSVIAVPIRSPSGVLGALYLDNRYRQRARFDAADTDLLLAFADQVALAIENARLVEALRARGEELLLARKKVEALAAQQAQEIERLAEEGAALKGGARAPLRLLGDRRQERGAAARVHAPGSRD